MGAIKSLLLVVLVITLMGVGVMVAANRGWLPSHPALAQVSSVAQTLPDWWANLTSQKNLPEEPLAALNQHQSLGILSERAGQVGDQVGAVLGSAVQVNSEATQSAQSLTQQTMEYAQYLYCQRVVTQWEAKQ